MRSNDRDPRKPRRPRPKYLPALWVWNVLMEMSRDVASSEVFFNSKEVGRRLMRMYKLPALPDNDTLRSRLEALEMLGFIKRPTAKERQTLAMQYCGYPIRLLQDELAILDKIEEHDTRHLRRPLPSWPDTTLGVATSPEGAAHVDDEDDGSEDPPEDDDHDEDPPDDEGDFGEGPPEDEDEEDGPPID